MVDLTNDRNYYKYFLDCYIFLTLIVSVFFSLFLNCSFFLDRYRGFMRTFFRTFLFSFINSRLFWSARLWRIFNSIYEKTKKTRTRPRKKEKNLFFLIQGYTYILAILGEIFFKIEKQGRIWWRTSWKKEENRGEKKKKGKEW